MIARHKDSPPCLESSNFTRLSAQAGDGSLNDRLARDTFQIALDMSLQEVCGGERFICVYARIDRKATRASHGEGAHDEVCGDLSSAGPGIVRLVFGA